MGAGTGSGAGPGVGSGWGVGSGEGTEIKVLGVLGLRARVANRLIIKMPYSTLSP